MALVLFRTGIWVLLAVLALWVLRDGGVLEDYAHLLSDELVTRLGIAGVAVLGLGFIVLIYEKLTVGPKKNKCKVCGRPVIAGEFFCREHLRDIVDRARQS
jgi:hypothetical protein